MSRLKPFAPLAPTSSFSFLLVPLPTWLALGCLSTGGREGTGLAGGGSWAAGLAMTGPEFPAPWPGPSWGPFVVSTWNNGCPSWFLIVLWARLMTVPNPLFLFSAGHHYQPKPCRITGVGTTQPCIVFASAGDSDRLVLGRKEDGGLFTESCSPLLETLPPSFHLWPYPLACPCFEATFRRCIQHPSSPSGRV